MNVTRSWKKLFAVGCSHGGLIDPVARKAVLTAKERWKPHKTIHLGDFVDTAAFRAGAKGTSDESEPVSPDFEAGLLFLKDLGANLIFNGNHEIRLWRLANHHNAIISELSKNLVERIETRAKLNKAEFVADWGMRSWRKLGNYSFGHGYIFSENACRDHAESHGNVVHAHTHRAGMAKGRRDDNPSGYCVGTLMDINSADYAQSKRSTLAWTQGFVWGEYCDSQAVIWLHEQPYGSKEWVFPF